MSAIGGMINNAIDAVTGNSRGTSLEDFLSKFSPAEGTFVNTIDPLHTFDVSIKFYPADASGKDDTRDLGQKVLDSLKSSGMKALNNLANNATGGLVGAIANSKSKPITDQRSSFSNVGKHTFLEYLCQANLMTNSDNYLGTLTGIAGQSSTSPLELNIGFYVQSMTVPVMKMEDGGIAETSLGKFPLNGRYVSPDNNTLVMSILNTKVPLLERIFYPWMRECTMPYWSYENQPYTTATITVDMTKHSDMKYVFYGCRPSQIATEQPTQEVDTTITRDITFIFDFMYVNSDLKTHESVTDKLLGTATSLLNSATKMMNI